MNATLTRPSFKWSEVLKMPWPQYEDTTSFPPGTERLVYLLCVSYPRQLSLLRALRALRAEHVPASVNRPWTAGLCTFKPCATFTWTAILSRPLNHNTSKCLNCLGLTMSMSPSVPLPYISLGITYMICFWHIGERTIQGLNENLVILQRFLQKRQRINCIYKGQS